MIALNAFPTELLSELSSVLNLQSLIRARCVSQRWRQTPLSSSASPIRCALYDLYVEAISSPVLAKSKEWIEEHLVSFDREAYVATLDVANVDVSEEFRIWVLEWPAKAAIAYVWPGLTVIPPQLYQFMVYPEDDDLFLGTRPSLRGAVLYSANGSSHVFDDQFDDRSPGERTPPVMEQQTRIDVIQSTESTGARTRAGRQLVEEWGDQYRDSFSLRMLLEESRPYVPLVGGNFAVRFKPWVGAGQA